MSFVTILFTWVVVVPDRHLFGDAPVQLGRLRLTFLGFLGLATPNFLLALVLLYFANVWFGISIGGLMDPEYLDQPWSWGKVALGARASLDPGDRHRHRRAPPA